MRIFAYLIAGVIAGASFPATPGHATVAHDKVDFTSIVHRQHAGIHPEQPGLETHVIGTAEEWINVWRQLTADQSPSPVAPAVDFDTHIVVGVIAGYDTGGYSLAIRLITEKGNSLLVDVLERSPGEDCQVAHSFTEPHHFVKVRRLGKPIEFSLKQDIYNCGP